jgi:MFS family permease
MYQIDASPAFRLARFETLRRVRMGVGRAVFALGCTSLLTDVSSEMVSTVLPLYLVVHLGLTPLQFGLVDGIYQGVTALVRLIGGVAADRWHRYKEVAAAGYGLSAVCKIGLGAAGAAWPVLAGIVALDRVGKGIRTAPRDALISLSTTPANLGVAFGVHRALDSAGALLGPLVALGLLARQPDRFDLVFVVSFAFAIVGLAVLLLFVETPAPSGNRAMAAPASYGPMMPREATYGRQLAGLTMAAGLLSLATVSDAFIYLMVQRQGGFNPALFPLMYVGTAGAFLLLAVPAGRLADRIGRRVTLLAGHGLLLLVYLVAARQDQGLVTAVTCVLLLGGYYAMTDGILMALASAMCPPARRASGMAVVTTMTSGARFVAPILFGAVWTVYDATSASYLFAGALVVAVLCAALILRATCGESDIG